MTYILLLFVFNSNRTVAQTFNSQDEMLKFLNDPSQAIIYQIDKTKAYSATAIPLKILYKVQTTQVVDKIMVGNK